MRKRDADSARVSKQIATPPRDGPHTDPPTHPPREPIRLRYLPSPWVLLGVAGASIPVLVLGLLGLAYVAIEGDDVDAASLFGGGLTLLLGIGGLVALGIVLVAFGSLMYALTHLPRCLVQPAIVLTDGGIEFQQKAPWRLRTVSDYLPWSDIQAITLQEHSHDQEHVYFFLHSHIETWTTSGVGSPLRHSPLWVPNRLIPTELVTLPTVRLQLPWSYPREGKKRHLWDLVERTPESPHTLPLALLRRALHEFRPDLCHEFEFD